MLPYMKKLKELDLSENSLTDSFFSAWFLEQQLNEEDEIYSIQTLTLENSNISERTINLFTKNIDSFPNILSLNVQYNDLNDCISLTKFNEKLLIRQRQKTQAQFTLNFNPILGLD